jgi:homoserine dehydrogenase
LRSVRANTYRYLRENAIALQRFCATFEAMNKSYRLALIGFGNVGQALAQVILEHNQRFERDHGVRFVITAICDAQHGSIHDPNGLSLVSVLGMANAGNRIEISGAQDKGWNALEMIERAEYDVLCELSFTDLDTGEPATSHVRAALTRGKHVVTTNKGPVALHYAALEKLAQANGVQFGIEGSVMSGSPTIRLGLELIRGANLRGLQGILNGTTNFMLTRMTQGITYQRALIEARALGYAEANPSGDVEGFDAAGKLVILANVLFGAKLAMSDVLRCGITQLSLEDIAQARAEGQVWKLVASLELNGESVTARVEPLRLPASHCLASVNGATNAITYRTELLGEVTVIGPGAGRLETAYALVQDVLAIHRTPVNTASGVAAFGVADSRGTV